MKAIVSQAQDFSTSVQILQCKVFSKAEHATRFFRFWWAIIQSTPTHMVLMKAEHKMYNVWFQKISIPAHGRDLPYDPPPLWKFQFSFIHCFKFLALQDPPLLPGISNPFCGGSMDIFRNHTIKKKQSKKAIQPKLFVVLKNN